VKPAWPVFALGCAALAGVVVSPWAAFVAVAALAALVAFAFVEARAAISEERIKALEDATALLKDTATALIKVERRVSAAEHRLDAALREAA
jgi:hypothetical protein